MSTHTETSPTPPITVRQCAKAFVVESRHVLLVKERHADGTFFWTFPGGGIGAGESRREALRRELDEELFCRGKISDRVAWFWYAHSSWPNTISRCHVYGCDVESPVRPNPREGIFDYRWVRGADIPVRTLFPVRHIVEQRLGQQ